MTAPLTDDEGQAVEPFACENGDGRLASVLLVDLAEGETNRLCGICHMSLMMAAAAEVAATMPAAPADTASAGA